MRITGINRARKALPSRPLLFVLMLAALLTATSAPAASAAVEWKSEVLQAPTNLQPGGRGVIRVLVENAGDTASTGFPTVSFELPSGVSLGSPENAFENGWTCSGSPVVTCTMNPLADLFQTGVQPGTYSAFFPGIPGVVNAFVDVSETAPEGVFPFQVTISNSDDTTIEGHQVRVDAEIAPFGTKPGSFRFGSFDRTGAQYTQAGGHPYETVTSFEVNTRFTEPDPPTDLGKQHRALFPVGELSNVVTDLPAGFLGNPLSAAKCSDLGLLAEFRCPPSAQVGVAWILPPYGTNGTARGYGVYNLEAPADAPAQFAFPTPSGPVVLKPVLRSDGDWGISAQVRNLTEIDALLGTTVALWGVPAEASHDAQRCARLNVIAGACTPFEENGAPLVNPQHGEPHEAGVPRRPFLTNPTRCDGQPLKAEGHFSQYQAPVSFEADGDPDLSDPDWANVVATSPPLTGCEALNFLPTLKARPTTDQADSPTGLEVDLHIPQNDAPDGLATAHLKDAVVTLPEGLVVNPSGANGLDACSPAEIGLTSAVGDPDASFDKLTDGCPAASKIGTVEVDTPLLEDPLRGSVYVATPQQNPFGSLLALYLTVKGPGILGKLAGKVTPDPETGRLTATFLDNPQVPFEDFKLSFFAGAGAALTTPPSCGTYSTTSSLTPWSAPQSGPPATPKDTYEISRGPDRGPCGSPPATPSFKAGSASPLGGVYSPFVLDLHREDGSQRFAKLTVSPPPGLIAKLAGTTPCADAALAAAEQKTGTQEKANPSCPAASEVGSVTAGAGSGPAPYYASGKAYLAGPYKGAPLSLAIVTPAVAGPYDLGTIVVRSALSLNPRTAQITASSDPIPQILKGIPLNIRSVQIRLDRPGFTRNGTSCEPTAVGGSLLSTGGAITQLSDRYQLAECGRLGFKPRMALFLRGGTKRSRFPALTAVVRPRAGDANIASVSVAMPPSEFLAQQHINTVCTRVQFAADKCPKGSIYGTATVTTPLLDYKLTGPVYLRSSDNPLPDLVPDLRGPAFQPIRLEAAGRTDSIRRGIRNTFDYVPDAPFTKLVVKLRGGKKGLLENSRDICAKTYRATVNYTAHNGKTHSAKPRLRTKCGKKGHKGKRRGHRPGR